MSTYQIEASLKAGITAAKAGRWEQARELLLQVVEVDEQNEQAWLWLSGVVPGDEDRRVCLENVLTINPDNELAQKGLARLGVSPDSQEAIPDQENDELGDTAVAEELHGEEIVVRKEYAPISLASAVLYPESQVKEWRYRDTTVIKQAPQVAIKQTSSYDDVWGREVDVCAYCAQEIEDEYVIECPQCGRNLMRKEFRYPEPSTNMHLLWILLAALGQLFMIQGIFDVILTRSMLGAATSGVLTLIFFGLAAGVYYRQSWAHLTSIIALCLVLLVSLVGAIFEVDLTALDSRLSMIDQTIVRVVGPLAHTVGDFLGIFQTATALLALFVAITKAASDFDKVDVQLIAKLDKGLNYASDYHAAAKAHAGKGRLATAVLHEQRAVAKAPHQVTYLRFLGLIYANLGFYDRSQDVLETACQFAPTPEKKADLQRLLKSVQQQMGEMNGQQGA